MTATQAAVRLPNGSCAPLSTSSGPTGSRPIFEPWPSAGALPVLCAGEVDRSPPVGLCAFWWRAAADGIQRPPTVARPLDRRNWFQDERPRLRRHNEDVSPFPMGFQQIQRLPLATR